LIIRLLTEKGNNRRANIDDYASSKQVTHQSAYVN